MSPGVSSTPLPRAEHERRVRVFVAATVPSADPRKTSSDACSFNVHGVLYVEDSGEVAPVEAEIRALSTGLQGVKDEQEYIVVRERVHRNSESGVGLSGMQSNGKRLMDERGDDRLVTCQRSRGIYSESGCLIIPVSARYIG